MDRTCDPCRVKGNTINAEIGSQRGKEIRMSTERQETPQECTGNAHARRIPDWLRPFKDQWLSAGRIKALIAADGRYFGPWFDEVRHRLRCVTEPATNGKTANKYLVRHVWAAALAHGLRLIPTEVSKNEAILRAENEDLRTALKRERGTVRVEHIKVDRTADSMDILRLLVACTEPQPRPGVYFLLDADASILYVGQSKNVLARMAGHADKTHCAVRMIHVSDEKRRLEVEGRLIEWFQPPLNMTGLGFRRESRPLATNESIAQGL